MKLLKRFAAGLAALAIFGCSSARLMDIDSKPSGASIFVNGEKKGVTRSQIKIDFGNASRVLVQLVKPRYKPVFQYWTIDEIPEENPKKIFTLEPD